MTHVIIFIFCVERTHKFKVSYLLSWHAEYCNDGSGDNACGDLEQESV